MANSIPTGGKRYSDLPETTTVEETDEMFMLRDNAGSRIGMGTLTSAIADKATGVAGIVSDAFDPEKEYAAGDYCIYDNTLYKFTEDKEAGEWDSDVAEQVEVANEISELNTKIYPIGSIYMSVSSTNPSTLFGGTWEQIKDVFLLAAGSSYSAGNTGGAATVALSSSEMPSHTHSLPSHTHDLPSHTHSLPSHTHSTPSHTHSIPALSGTAASAGSHSHAIRIRNGIFSSGSSTANTMGFDSGSDTSNGPCESGGAHTHTVTTTSSTTGSSSGTSGSTSGTSGSTSGTSGSTSGTSESTGSGSAHNNMPPYLAVYMWQRVA